jgi:hypothetical protein
VQEAGGLECIREFVNKHDPLKFESPFVWTTGTFTTSCFGAVVLSYVVTNINQLYPNIVVKPLVDLLDSKWTEINELVRTVDLVTFSGVLADLEPLALIRDASCPTHYVQSQRSLSYSLKVPLLN